MTGDLEICSAFLPGNFGGILGNTYNSVRYTGNFYGLNYIFMVHCFSFSLVLIENWKLFIEGLRCQSYGSINLHILLFPKASCVKPRPTKSSLKEYYNQTISVLGFDHDIAGNPADKLLLQVWRPYQPYQ